MEVKLKWFFTAWRAYQFCMMIIYWCGMLSWLTTTKKVIKPYSKSIHHLIEDISRHYMTYTDCQALHPAEIVYSRTTVNTHFKHNSMHFFPKTHTNRLNILIMKCIGKYCSWKLWNIFTKLFWLLVGMISLFKLLITESPRISKASL